MKVLLIIGTRPEAIKMVPVYQALSQCEWCTPYLTLTGQHREMARSVLDLFGVHADLDLDVMEPGQSLVELSARLTLALSKLVEAEQFDAILVQGDTTSAMIGGWLGFYAGCRVGHVEAGLRTGNLAAPYPEEYNRRVIALACHWHFSPTERAAINLRSEGIADNNIYIVGNTVVDAALDIAQRSTGGIETIRDRLAFLGRADQRTILVTAHRRENFGTPMREISAAIAEIADSYRDVRFVVPVHPNPIVGATLQPVLSGRENVKLIDPLDYDQLIHVLCNSYLVLTDSGGIQEEAPAFGVPVLILRNETERIEGIEAGCSQLVGTACTDIVQATTRLLTDTDYYTRMAQTRNPYGDGQSGQRIAELIGQTC